MSNANDFVIENGVLKKYIGSAGVVVIPDGVVEIGASAFVGSKTLTELVMPDSVKIINEEAFQKCSKLKKVKVSAQLEEIKSGAFQNCKALKELSLPDTLRRMGDEVFLGCAKLSKLTCKYERLDADENGLVIVDNRLFHYRGSEREVIVPEGVTSIERRAFFKTGIKSVQLPSTLTTIKGLAFSNCDMLTTIEIPEGVISIEEWAFSACTKLQQVKLPSTLELIENAAFEQCKNITEIEIPNSVTEIGKYVFEECEKLERVVLSKRLKVLPTYVFKNCKALREIEIPNSVELIETSAFDNCPELREVRFHDFHGKISGDAFNNCPALKNDGGFVIIHDILWRYEGVGGDVVIPEGIRVIRENAFREGVLSFRNGFIRFHREGLLKSVVLPRSMEEIHRAAFAGCICLEEVTMPEGLKVVGEEAFQGCLALTNVFIPASVETIGEAAFSGCEGLTKLTVGEDGMCSVQDGILFGEGGKELLYCPENLHLREYTIPTHVERIASRAFIDCWELEKIVIPATVKYVGGHLTPKSDWKRASALKYIEVEIGAGSEGVGEDVFDMKGTYCLPQYPKLPVTFPQEKEVQYSLALSYCEAPEMYSGAYAEQYFQFAVRNNKTLCKRATKQERANAERYLDELLMEIPAAEDGKKKLTEKEKVQVLESAVLEGNVQKLREILDTHKQFEFTARAMGYACLYGGLEIVKTLVDHGLSFQYAASNSEKYGAGLQTTYAYYRSSYDLMLAVTDVNVWIPTLLYQTHMYHFGKLPEITAPLLSETKRADIVDYFLTCQGSYFNAESVLYYAILWGCRPVAERLLHKGITLNQWAIDVLSNQTKDAVSRNELIATLPTLGADACVYAMQTYASLLKNYGRKLVLTPKVFDGEKTVFKEGAVLRCMVESTDTEKFTKSKLMQLAVDGEAVDALNAMVTAGWLRTPALREKLIQYASEQGKYESLTWLMDYKNKTADLKAEAAKEEKKQIREMMQAPDSVSALKKIWSYKTLEDGTLVITSYKGFEEHIAVPVKIGTAPVTVIGEEAFSSAVYSGRVKNLEARRKIKSVVIPDGIVEIEKAAFYGCSALESVTLPDSLHSIHQAAFRECESLQTVRMPTEIPYVGKGVFWGCNKLADEDGFIVLNGYFCGFSGQKYDVVIPDGVRAIGPYAFTTGSESYGSKNTAEILEEIILPASVERIDAGAFAEMRALKRVVLTGNVRDLGAVAFGRAGLEEIVMPEGPQSIGERVFQQTKLTEVRIPKSVTKIGALAFYQCHQLRDLYIPRSVTDIGEHLLGDYDGEGYKAVSGIYIHTPAGSAAEQYIKAHYKSLIVVNDYDLDGKEKPVLARELAEVVIEEMPATTVLQAVGNTKESTEDAPEECTGLTFVITGKVNHFANRDAFKEYVEAHGGKVAGSVSKNTDYLVNNDSESTSSKNKKAKELGVPIITEGEFILKFGK